MSSEVIESAAFTSLEQAMLAVAYWLTTRFGTARYLTRPFGPPVAGLARTLSLGLPFLLSGALKACHDLTLWAWFRRVPLLDAPPSDASASTAASSGLTSNRDRESS
jgi:hypothetical protein